MEHDDDFNLMKLGTIWEPCMHMHGSCAAEDSVQVEGEGCSCMHAVCS